MSDQPTEDAPAPEPPQPIEEEDGKPFQPNHDNVVSEPEQEPTEEPGAPG